MQRDTIKVGVIRWDAWVGELNQVGCEVEKCLSKKEYHNRLPFYTTFKNNEVQIRCDSKEIIKQEINYASKYGIDYFAFCWYPFGSGLDTARNIFLQIQQTKIKWCLILGTNPFNENDALWLIEQFSKPNYQKIENRPIVYIFDIHENLLNIVNFIRDNCFNFKPYLIGMVWNKEQAKKMDNLFHLDAISQYCTPGKNNLTYHELSRIEVSKWNEYASLNKVVPWVTTGWDKRPRYDSPVFWEDCSDFNTQYIQNPTSKELQNELISAYEFSQKHNSKTFLLYAWNEFDEGGFIAPTLKDNSINTDKLKAIQEVVNKYKNR